VRSAFVLLAASGCWFDKGPSRAAPLDQPRPVRTVERDQISLAGHEQVVLGDHVRVPAVCIDGDARLAIDGSATLEIIGTGPVVIGGRGIGPVGEQPAKLRLIAREVAELWVLFDNKQAAIEVDFIAPQSKVNVAITGQTGLTINGKIREAVHNAAWGLPANYPHCAR